MGLGGALKKVGSVATGGLLGGGGAPQERYYDLDQGTKDLLQKQVEGAQKTPEEYAQERTVNLERPAQELMEGSKDQFTNEHLGVSPNDLSDSLSDRYKRKFLDQKYQALNSERSQGVNRQIQAQDKALKAAQTLSRVRTEQSAIDFKNKALKKQARGRMLGNVLGIGGAVAGAMVPGAGAAGAIAGNTIGQGLGNTIGGM